MAPGEALQESVMLSAWAVAVRFVGAEGAGVTVAAKKPTGKRSTSAKSNIANRFMKINQK
ncbi:MAG: hypothetical protein NUV67_05650 [archaeon]|nr:hypothetical protein [archaeon]